MIKLQTWEKEDAQIFFELSNTFLIHQNMNDAFPKTLDDTKILMKSMIINNEQQCLRKIIADDKVIGCIGVFINGEQGEIAYWLHPDYWGRGIMKESITMFIDWIKSNYQIHSLIATPFHKNKASQRVLEKCGFVHDQTLINYIKKEDQYIDCELYIYHI